MKTAVQIFIRQTGRSTKCLILQLVLLCAAVAFFVVSLNLYANSRGNLQTVADSYKTIATIEIYGDVNETGALVGPGDADFVGRYLLSPDDFDLSAILDLPGVTGYDLRQRYVACLPEEILVKHITDSDDLGYSEGLIELVGNEDVLSFTINSKNPIEIPITVISMEYRPSLGTVAIPIHLLDQTLSHITYTETISLDAPVYWQEELDNYIEDIRRLNRSDRTDATILYPDVEYVLAGYFGAYFKWDESTGTYTFKTNRGIGGGDKALRFITISDLFSYLQCSLEYDVYGNTHASINLIKEGAPYRLQRYEDVKDDPAWARSAECIQYTNQSLPLTTTNDIEQIPAWYKGGMYLQEGRMITAEEYASGAKVCMISAQTAEYQGWKIGDTLKMQCYDYDGYWERTGTTELYGPNYYRGLEGFFHTGEYEIVGIFGQREVTDLGDTAEEVFYNPWNTIYVPTNSVENAPDEPVQASTLTLYLQNGSIPEFQAAVETLGLTEQKTGQYQLKFSCFDQATIKFSPAWWR